MDKYLKLILILVLFAAKISVAQIIEFEHVYGGSGYDYGYSVTQTYDKGYAVAGSTSSSGSGSTDAYLLKTDSMGIMQWQKTFGGINIDQAYSIQETKDTGFVIAGFTNSFGQGGYDLYVIRTNRYGDTIWTKTYGGSNWDFAYSIQQTIDSGFIITGGTYSFGKGYEDMYLVKINSIGDTIWTKTYGGIKDDEAKSVKQTKDGGYIITGFTKSFGDANGDFYTVKTNNVGDTLWTNKYGGIQEDDGYDVIEKYSGGYFIVGKTKSSGAGNFDGLLINMSTTGLFIWSNLYGGTDDDGINSVKQSPGGRWGMAGYTYSYGFAGGASDFALYIENAGLHSTTFGGTNMEKAYSINNTKDNGYIICGYSSSYSNLDHIFLVKTDSNGVSPATPQVTLITSITSNIKPNTTFKIFPNPADGNVYLNFNSKGLSNNNSVTISIIDMIGRKYYYQKINNMNTLEQIEINTSNLNTGIYIINIEGDNYSVNQKLIIEH